MRKRFPSLLALVCAAMLAWSVPMAATAENGEGPTGSTTAPNTTTTVTPPTTEAKEPSFTFTVSGSAGSQTLNVRWNAAELPGVRVVRVAIGPDDPGGNDFIVNDNTGKFSLSLAGEVKPGRYSLSFYLSDGRSVHADSQLKVDGELSTSMTLQVRDGQITVELRDEVGRGIGNYPITLSLNGNAMPSESTDANGRLVFSTLAPDGALILCVAKNQTVNGISYLGCTQSYGGSSITTRPTTTTSTTPRTTTTTRSTTTTTTSATTTTGTVTTSTQYSLVAGAGTTAVVGDKIAVNASYDTEIPKAFGISGTDFAARARALMDKSLYDSVIGTSNSTMMLAVRSSSLEITDHFISTAISGQSKYSTFDAEDTLRTPVELSMLFVDAQHGLTTPITVPSGEITVELPVPKSMSDASKYTVVAAVANANGIVRLVDTTVTDGIMSFTIHSNELSSLALLGFQGAPGDDGSNGGVPTLVIILIVIGVLLLGGAGFLLYFFFLRKDPEDPDDPDSPENPEDPENPDGPGSGPGGPEGGEDASPATPDQQASFGNLRPAGLGERPEGGPDNEPPVGIGSTSDDAKESIPGVSLGSLLNHPAEGKAPAKKNPADYDIEL